MKAGKVVARATNRARNDPAVIQTPLAQSAHAEVRALRQVANPEGSTVYVARARPDGSAALSEPCEACRQVMNAAGVRRVVWTV